ncbi:MAG TPA: 23S rRNA (guanosine(2251)-2'-O)-methyltransferase RlmB [Rectinemataceae bacterium]|nr:23S rRNA (guanosine(2251)-2'-O)-methyltransferase RlmB [Rectinemataceae bacterium]
MDYITSFHGILETLKAKPSQMKILLASGQGSRKPGPRIRGILELAKKKGIAVDQVGQDMLDRIDPDNKGVALSVLGKDVEKSLSLDDFLENPPDGALVIILDHIEDPQNFGAILRSADAFGANLVVAPTRRASPLGDAAARTSAGASAWVPVAFVQNLTDAVKRLQGKGFWVYAADMGGAPLSGLHLPAKTCFVLGNEGEGVSRLLVETSDAVVSIPMRGHVDSLNVSVAAALFMYEYRRAHGE